MRSIIPTLLICACAIMALGAHRANALVAPVQAAAQTDVYSSPEAARHRTAQPRHWGAMVLVTPK